MATAVPLKPLAIQQYPPVCHEPTLAAIHGAPLCKESGQLTSAGTDIRDHLDGANAAEKVGNRFMGIGEPIFLIERRFFNADCSCHRVLPIGNSPNR